MVPIEIAKGVYDVGVNDWNIDDFHGYSTPYGTSYNAFLIVDEKITLIDTVKKEFCDQLIANIARITDPKNIDYVVSNHTEMDHSGSLPRVMHRIGAEKPVYCSKLGAKNIDLHFHGGLNLVPVKDGQELSIGKRTLTFLETRMVHWPDSMFTYLKEDRILFSSDGFGQHYAGFEKYDDVVGDAIMPHAQKYYANILMLYSPLILKLIDKVVQSGLAIDMICPDHGIIWRKDPGKIIDAYARWSKHTAKRKAVLVYDTMWHSTEQMADAIASGLNAEGIEGSSDVSAQMAPQRYHDRGAGRQSCCGGIAHAQQQSFSHGERFSDLHERPEAAGQDRRRIRILWMEWGGRQNDQ